MQHTTYKCSVDKCCTWSSGRAIIPWQQYLCYLHHMLQACHWCARWLVHAVAYSVFAYQVMTTHPHHCVAHAALPVVLSAACCQRHGPFAPLAALERCIECGLVRLALRIQLISSHTQQLHTLQGTQGIHHLRPATAQATSVGLLPLTVVSLQSYHTCMHAQHSCVLQEQWHVPYAVGRGSQAGHIYAPRRGG